MLLGSGQGCQDRLIPKPDEIPVEIGVMQVMDEAIEILRSAPKKPMESLPFGIWMALVKAVPRGAKDFCYSETKEQPGLTNDS